MTQAIYANDAIKQILPDQTTGSGDLVTQTASNQLAQLLKNPEQVTGAAPDPADTTPAQTRGVENPYGLGIAAFEPNTTPAIHALADSQTEKAAQGTDFSTLGKDYSSASNDVAKRDAEEQAVRDAQQFSVDYAGGGVTNATGKVQTFITAALQAAAHNVPYVWGGTSLTSGVDCSGLIYAAAQAAGITDWKRFVAADYNKFPQINPTQARPGDIVYWAPGQNGVGATGHVGIYLGNGQMVVAPQSGETVKIEPVFGSPRYHRIFTDDMFGAVATPGGGATYNYNGRPVNWAAQTTTAMVGNTLSAAFGSLGGFSSAFGRINAMVSGALHPTTTYSGGAVGGSLKVNVPYSSQFSAAGAKYGVPASLLAAVAKQESGFNPTVHSSAGAVGLMQFMPATAAGLGVNPLDPNSAIDGAARMLAGLYRQFGSWQLALAAYNAGSGNVRKYGGIPPFTETQNYVRNVSAIAAQYGGV